ncbi:MAG: acyl-CoA dehydrogenase family protein [Candidatus Binatus sp.]|uniref:acyl-CoA dehydrogenase family protein n=1 Tax=Candidatus Binatus sp. TaxID=2811406 RepID=UPI003C77C7DA
MDAYMEIDRNLPADLRALRENVHRFAKEVLRPAATELDRLPDPQDVIAPGSALWTFMRQAYALGYHTASFPEAIGGLGLHGLGMQIFLEELGWGSADLAISLGVAGAPFAALAMAGNPELTDAFVKPFIADRDARLIGSWPVTEPNHGSDWAMFLASEGEANPAGRATIRREGDSYVVHGQKAAWVSNGTISTHGIVYLMAPAVGGQPAGGVVAFIPFDLPGVSKGKPLNKIGQRALNQGEIFFDNVRIPNRYVLATPEAFPMVAAITLTNANSTMAAVFTGVARAAFESAMDYSKQRIQGGKPICEHQLVQKRLFDMFTRVEACRALSRAVMVHNDPPPAIDLEYAIAAKTFCTQASFEIASDALQIFGGNGLSREYPIEKIFRDARASLIEDGTNDVLSLTGALRILDLNPVPI